MYPDTSSSDRSTERKPFETEPRRVTEPGGGCSRLALIGCSAAVILVGVGLVAMMLKARDLVVWSLTSVRSEIEQSLPEGLPEADRARLTNGFEAALETVRSDDLDPQKFRRLQAALLEFARSPEAPDRDAVRQLSEALERFAASDRLDSEEPEEAPSGDGPSPVGEG